MMAPGEIPLTQGYTINIVKDRCSPAVILLNSCTEEVKGGQRQTYFITVPASHIEIEAMSGPPPVETEEPQHGAQQTVLPNSDCVDHQGHQVYYDASYDGMGLVTSVSPWVCYTEVAHEEVVQLETETHTSRTSGDTVRDSEDGETVSVHCDLCDSTLRGTELAKCHMRVVHNILAFQGPFFKCDFCGLFVTDRVAHMKAAHYSPLAQEFRKLNNMYECLRCNYTSDQLTNIRNHVDAKHRTGENTYVCEECTSQYKTLNSMRAHKSRVHGRKRRLEEGRRKEEKVQRGKEGRHREHWTQIRNLKQHSVKEGEL